jgi:hypothetical protein
MTIETQQQSTISKKCFSMVDQINFAKLSGDINPIHMNPLTARRTLSGQCIVHGMHTLLWALESLLREKNLSFSEVTVVFRKPVFLDEDISCIWIKENNQLLLTKEKITLVEIRVKNKAPKPNNNNPTNIFPLRKKPQQPTFEDCTQFINQPFGIYGDTHLANALFPLVSAKLGSLVVNELAGISQIIGMECPGLHSLFTSLTASFRPNNKTNPGFSVKRHDARFGLLHIAIEGNSLQASAQAFLRPSSVLNKNISKLSDLVHKNEFKNSSALIIGGSRGLGELVAKLIAVGGGEPIITYSVGKLEAESLRDEILGWGGKCKIMQLTVDKFSTLPTNMKIINQLYYFATPKIFGKRNTSFDIDLKRKFTDIYVDGFENICKSIIKQNIPASVLYPSTVAIDEPIPALLEYISAKVEGEKTCHILNKNKFLHILTPRLPRLDTDQTVSIIKVDTADTIEIMLPLVREMQMPKC